MAAGMLLAAEEIFAESGLAKAHVEDIARRAGVAVGTLYNYYKDRDALLAAVLSLRVGELSDALLAASERTEGESTRERLRALSGAYISFFLRRRTFMRILSEGELTQLKESYPTSAAIPGQSWKTCRDLFAEVINEGAAKGAIDPRHTDLDLWLFLGLLKGVVMRDLRGAGTCQESDADRAVELFFDGAHPPDAAAHRKAEA
jgi:AcrR family transcriptional regulator